MYNDIVIALTFDVGAGKWSEPSLDCWGDPVIECQLITNISLATPRNRKCRRASCAMGRFQCCS